jgi:hypothetical protein
LKEKGNDMTHSCSYLLEVKQSGRNAWVGDIPVTHALDRDAELTAFKAAQAYMDARGDALQAVRVHWSGWSNGVRPPDPGGVAPFSITIERPRITIERETT